MPLLFSLSSSFTLFSLSLPAFFSFYFFSPSVGIVHLSCSLSYQNVCPHRCLPLPACLSVCLSACLAAWLPACLPVFFLLFLLSVLSTCPLFISFHPFLSAHLNTLPLSLRLS